MPRRIQKRAEVDEFRSDTNERLTTGREGMDHDEEIHKHKRKQAFVVFTR